MIKQFVNKSGDPEKNGTPLRRANAALHISGYLIYHNAVDKKYASMHLNLIVSEDIIHRKVNIT